MDHRRVIGCEPLERRCHLTATIRMDVGSAVNTRDISGFTWTADAYSTGGTTDNLVYDVAKTSNDLLHRSRRWGNFTCAIPVDNGSYGLNLYFADPSSSAAGQRKFDVFAEGKQIINDLDLYASTGPQSATSRSFTLTVTDGVLNLSFVNVVGNATLSALEVSQKSALIAPPVSTWKPLFNGVDLNGFYTYLPSQGVNKDPKGIFKVENGLLHFLGTPVANSTQEYGYLSTTGSYANYRLKFDYKWGTKKFAPKTNLPRDSGVMFHVNGPDKIFPNAVEFQVQENDTGDVWLLEQVRGTGTIASGGTSSVVRTYKEGGSSYTFTKPYARLIKQAKPEKLTDWNTGEIIVNGDAAVYIVNGVVVNRIAGLMVNGSALTSGKIQFQAEGAEIYYRNIVIQSLPYTAPPAGATVLFNGSGSSAWRKASSDSPIRWTIANGALQVAPGTGDIISKQTFSDFVLHLEFRNNLTPGVTNEQDKGNSGVYLQRRYELQVLDSFGHSQSGKNDAGAIYGIYDASANAALPAEAWQTYDIAFKAARWTGNIKTTKARVTVKLNGIVVQNDVEISTSTFLGSPEANSSGPILLQDHGNKVQYRNIWIKPS